MDTGDTGFVFIDNKVAITGDLAKYKYYLMINIGGNGDRFIYFSNYPMYICGSGWGWTIVGRENEMWYARGDHVRRELKVYDDDGNVIDSYLEYFTDDNKNAMSNVVPYGTTGFSKYNDTLYNFECCSYNLYWMVNL